MTTVKIRVGSAEQARSELGRALKALEHGRAVRAQREIWFSTLGQAAAVLTEERLELLRTLRRQRPATPADLARVVERPLRTVRRDLIALAEVGLVRFKAGDQEQRPVATCDRIQIDGILAIARAA